jgi:hypothetical protein
MARICFYVVAEIDQRQATSAPYWQESEPESWEYERLLRDTDAERRPMDLEAKLHEQT